jgi:putative salt-induced outer membrane protein YdiY
MQSIFLLLLFLSSSAFALVDIKPVTIGEKPGFTGHVALSLSTKRGNTETDVYKGDVKLQFDNNTTHATWLELAYSYGKASDVENTNKSFTHLRHIHAITSKCFAFELFAQTQQDKFRSIQARDLAGAGLRLRVADTKTFGEVYIGVGAYSEYINYDDPTLDPTEHNNRFSSYIAYSHTLGKDSSITYLGYYQPIYKNLGDFYTSQSLELKVNVYLELYLSIKVDYDADQSPALGREKEDFSQTTSFVWKF